MGGGENTVWRCVYVCADPNDQAAGTRKEKPTTTKKVAAPKTKKAAVAAA